MARPSLPPGSWGKIKITRLPGGGWQARCRYRHWSGEVQQVASFSQKSKTAAEIRLQAKLSDLRGSAGGGNAAVGPDEVGPDTTMTRLGAIWLRTQERRHDAGELAASTLDGYRKAVTRYIAPDREAVKAARKRGENPVTGIGSLKVREATTGRLERFLDELKDRGYKSVPHHVRVALSGMMDLAVRHTHHFQVNPVAGVRRRRRARNQVRVLETADLTAIHEAMSKWSTEKRPGPKVGTDPIDIYKLQLGTGSRIGEVLALNWPDVEFLVVGGNKVKVKVTIRATIVTVKGKGTFRQERPKSAKSYRTITLPGFAAEVLIRRRAVLGDAEPTGGIFLTRNGTYKQPNNVRRQWRAARKGTPYEWVTPHVYRKTVATVLDDQLDADTAAKVLGHSSSEITRQFYIHRPEEAPDVSDVMEVLDPETHDLGKEPPPGEGQAG